MMEYNLFVLVTAALLFHVIEATQLTCPSDPNCDCEGGLALEINCKIDGRKIQISLLPATYLNILCDNPTTLNYDKLPKCANRNDTFKSVFFKNCPLPRTSFKAVLDTLGVSRTLALIFQNAKNLTGYFDRKLFTGLHNLTKLLISVRGLKYMPDDLFEDINMLQWLSIRSNSLNLSQELFKPLGRLQTLEISHNHMSNISSKLFSHLSFLRKLSIWQSNSWFSKDLFTGADVLEELDLSSNGLDELPEAIFEPLKKLKKLTLFANKFTSLPKNLFQFNDELESVSMLNNDLELGALPERLFGNLPNMKQVYLQKCGLKDVSYNLFWNSSKIMIISLAYNHIRKLPEVIFNDQINLSELDLSSNQLQMLGPKLFSSLVRLNKLNLAHNELTKISGSTFSPLYSLSYLNVDHNKLQVIDSLLFVHNRQKMTISMAYNKLDLEDESLANNTWCARKTSPFASLFNMKLLNLSHNEFKHTFKDWWVNGHDALDISYNQLEYLRSNEKEPETFCFLKPMIELRVSHNNLQCGCVNNEFIDFMLNEQKTKMDDFPGFGHCPFWTKGSCKVRTTFMLVVIGLFLLYIVCVLIHNNAKEFRKYLYERIKDASFVINKQKHKKMDKTATVVEYSKDDEEFVLKEILPELQRNLGLKQCTSQRNNATNEQIFLTTTHSNRQLNKSFVIFSPNYLTSHYSHVNIKTIKGEMMEAKNTIFVFVDIGSENTIHAFLKEQRDPTTTIVWKEPYFWNRVKNIATNGKGNSNKTTKFSLSSVICSRPIKNPNEALKAHALDTSTTTLVHF